MASDEDYWRSIGPVMRYFDLIDAAICSLQGYALRIVVSRSRTDRLLSTKQLEIMNLYFGRGASSRNSCRGCCPGGGSARTGMERCVDKDCLVLSGTKQFNIGRKFDWSCEVVRSRGNVDGTVGTRAVRDKPVDLGSYVLSGSTRGVNGLSCLRGEPVARNEH